MDYDQIQYKYNNWLGSDHTDTEKAEFDLRCKDFVRNIVDVLPLMKVISQ